MWVYNRTVLWIKEALWIVKKCSVQGRIYLLHPQISNQFA